MSRVSEALAALAAAKDAVAHALQAEHPRGSRVRFRHGGGTAEGVVTGHAGGRLMVAIETPDGRTLDPLSAPAERLVLEG
jgi:hypothetical protein